MANTVNEKSPLYMNLVFKDESGVALIPTTVEWRLDNSKTGVQIVAWTALVSPAATMSMVISGANNLITDETHTKEGRIFGVRVDDGLATEAHQELKYHVLNLSGPTGV